MRPFPAVVLCGWDRATSAPGRGIERDHHSHREEGTVETKFRDRLHQLTKPPSDARKYLKTTKGAAIPFLFEARLPQLRVVTNAHPDRRSTCPGYCYAFLVNLHRGYPVHPRNCVPAFGPFRAVRSISVDPHFGHTVVELCRSRRERMWTRCVREPSALRCSIAPMIR